MPDVNQFSPVLAFPTVTIANGQTTSAAIDLHGGVLCGFFVATMTGTAIKFHASSDNSTFVVMKDTAGSDVSVTISDDHYVRLDPKDFEGVRYLKLVSGSAEGAERTITLAVRPR